MVEYVCVGGDHVDRRLDNFLMGYFKNVPKSLVYRIIRTGQVRINKSRVKPDYRLKLHDALRIPPVKKNAAIPQKMGDCHWLEQTVLFENEHLMVINKPAGIPVHGGSGVHFSLIHAVRAIRPNCPDVSLVHRLDKQTSGCLMLAKTMPALKSLQQDLMQGHIKKSYVVLVKGQWRQSGPVFVDQPLSKNVVQSGERMVHVDHSGKASKTEFYMIKQYPHAALLGVSLYTGRTHQIRVHAAYMGHDVAGDSKYGTMAFNQHMQQLGLKRLFLHARHLSLHLPFTHQRIMIKAPLGNDLKEVLKKL